MQIRDTRQFNLLHVLRKAGQGGGTRAYRAPQRVQNRDEIDDAVDARHHGLVLRVLPAHTSLLHPVDWLPSGLRCRDCRGGFDANRKVRNPEAIFKEGRGVPPRGLREGQVRVLREHEPLGRREVYRLPSSSLRTSTKALSRSPFERSL